MNIRKKSGSGMSSPANDAQHWNRCIERISESQDREAFTALFSHFSPMLKAFLLKSGGVTPENAEELVQETMIKVWRKAPTFSASQASASTWIYTIARNTRIDWLRQQARKDPNDLNAEDIYDERETPTPFSSLVHLRNKRQIGEQLKLLPRDQSEVLQMMYFQGKSGQQVADALDLPLGTVKSRIRLALRKLKLSMAATQEDSVEGTYA